MRIELKNKEGADKLDSHDAILDFVFAFVVYLTAKDNYRYRTDALALALEVVERYIDDYDYYDFEVKFKHDIAYDPEDPSLDAIHIDIKVTSIFS